MEENHQSITLKFKDKHPLQDLDQEATIQKFLTKYRKITPGIREKRFKRNLRKKCMWRKNLLHCKGGDPHFTNTSLQKHFQH